MDKNLFIEELLFYAKVNFEIEDPNDLIYLRNIILGEMELDNLEETHLTKEREEEILSFKNPDYFTTNLTEYFKEKGYDEKEIELKVTKIFGFLTPLPSEVTKKFYEIYKEDGDEEALNYFYDLCIKNDYVKISKINKNLKWVARYTNKYIEISINLSKPEKKTSDIAKLLKKDNSLNKYPKCLLCKENLGYYGRNDHPARENIRMIPIKLSKEDWYMQFSPYGYFDMHSIILKNTHDNMKINKQTFDNLLEFVDKFPYFFIGSNADLPIVGGSILNHEHYQGGKHLLPIMKTIYDKKYSLNSKYSSNLYLLDWYNTTLLIEGKDKEEVSLLADKILSKWRNYDDLNNDILSFTDNEYHNTITPCARKVNDTYLLYLILRNNRCSEDYKEGIFHAHPEYHHIKHENIGIIEAMGLFILPARLLREIMEIKDSLKNNLTHEEILSRYPDLNGLFLDMIDELKENYNEEHIDYNITHYINEVCKDILINTSVFKNTIEGKKGIDNFIKEVFLYD